MKQLKVIFYLYKKPNDHFSYYNFPRSHQCSQIFEVPNEIKDTNIVLEILDRTMGGEIQYNLISGQYICYLNDSIESTKENLEKILALGWDIKEIQHV